MASRRDALLVEQRRIETEILAATLVLDERGRIDDSLAARDGVDLRDLRARVETARAFDALPEVASAAGAGLLSVEQAKAAVKVADAGSDREWAERARRMSPADLNREARRARPPSVEDTRRRHEARFALPDLQGAAFASVIHQITEQMRPAPGEPWERPERRAAALVALVDRAAGKTGTAADGVRPTVVVSVPVAGPAEVADGVLLGVEQVEQLRANSTVEVAVVDEAGSDDFPNLAAVCAPHHQRLVPYGTWVLSGNPNQPDGLALVRDQPGQPRRVGDRGASGTHDRPPTKVRTRVGPAG